MRALMDKIEWYVDPKDESLHMKAHKAMPDGSVNTKYEVFTREEMFFGAWEKSLIELKLHQLWKEMGI